MLNPNGMQQDRVRAALAGLPLGGLRCYDKIGSTNDDAKCWAAAGCDDFALVLANEQTAGRGRNGRSWASPPGGSLSFSLVLKPHKAEEENLPRLTALGTLAVKETLYRGYGLAALIKWPNDILIHGKKLGGVLVETSWDGNRLMAAVLGIGINVALDSSMLVNRQLKPDSLPATSIEAVLGVCPDRLALLRGILKNILAWRPRLSSDVFLEAWESGLAYRRDWVQIIDADVQLPEKHSQGDVSSPSTPLEGYIIGLTQDGSLRLRSRSGRVMKVSAGEIHLRPTKTADPDHQIY